MDVRLASSLNSISRRYHEPKFFAMAFTFVDALGAAAGITTTLTFLPQVIKTWREKSAKDVSLLMFLIAAANEVMWISWAVLLKPMNWVIIGTNLVLLVFSSLMIWLKMRYNR